MRCRGWVAVSFVACARLAFAQQAHGIVRDSLSRQPIPGAVVSALQADGATLARALSNEAGAYSLPLPPGTARLRVVRIGFHPVNAPAPADTASMHELNFTLDPLPSLLETVTANEGKECPGRGDRDQALGLWEQARDGLLASVAARDTRPGDMATLSSRRVYAADRSSPIWQQFRAESARTSRPYIPIATAAYFAEHGYRLEAGGVSELGAPDVDVLLDDSFAATHCFSISKADAAHAGEIGLAFEPAPGRDALVDVRGVLWIDRAMPAVRTLEFRYTGLARWQASAGAGGTISFVAMPNGVVFIDSWSITSAESAPAAVGPGWRPRMAPQTRLEVAGGVVTAARWPDGSHWEVPTASVHGYVEAVPDVAVAGVRVWLGGTSDTTTTDSLGRFRFAGLLPGTYAIEAAEPPLAAAAISQNPATDSAVATLPDTAPAVVRLHPATTALRELCGDPSRRMPETVLLVRVVDGDGWNVARDSVVATWNKPSSALLGMSFPHEGRSEGLTDDDGRAAICDPPRGEPVGIVVGHERAPQASTTVTLPMANRIALVVVQVGAPGSR